MRTPNNLIHLAFRGDTPPEPAIEPGSRDDYRAFAGLHYRARPPATITRVLRATEPGSGEPIGVLVASRPTLNGAWRRDAWPGRFDFCRNERGALEPGSKRRLAERLNAELRTISRVIVDPRFRGRGVAVALVRRYLDSPETPCTEAVAAMGAFSPFFERAGMRRLTAPGARPARDRRLLRIAARAGIGHADELAAALLRGVPPTLEPRLRSWARASTSTRRLADGPIGPIAAAAAGSLLAPQIAYAHTADR
ncbi:MAG: hypothetical protein AAGF47_01810 [Planctomycetota bacterium]